MLNHYLFRGWRLQCVLFIRTTLVSLSYYRAHYKLYWPGLCNGVVQRGRRRLLTFGLVVDQTNFVRFFSKFGQRKLQIKVAVKYELWQNLRILSRSNGPWLINLVTILQSVFIIQFCWNLFCSLSIVIIISSNKSEFYGYEVFYAIDQSCWRSASFVYYLILLKFDVLPFYDKMKIKFQFEQILRT